MHPPGADTVLVRYGDMSTKSHRVRRRMERRLVANVEALLDDRGVEGTVEDRRMRPLVRTTEDQVERAARTAADAFGVVSTSPARAVAPDLDAVCSALGETAPEVYDGGTFAVDARRAGDHDFTSSDLEREGGSAVWTAVEDRFEPAVDLEDPDVTVGVEAREEEAYVYLERVDGPGGLPLGSQERLVALVSGGIDSPVAAYETMRRGSPVLPVYLDLGDYGGPDHEARAVETVRTLSRYAPDRDLRVLRVPAGEDVDHLVETMDRGRMLAFRRYMYRVAETVARSHDLPGVVTGESVGQKSSQTARNLGVTSRAVDLPVHRPLLTWDKNDIVARARAIGTFDDSTIPAGCNRFVPDRPETNARLERLRGAEPADLFERAERAAREATPVEP